MRRQSIARMTYGKPRSEHDATTTGRVARARNLRVKKISDATFASCCGAPEGYCLCSVRKARRPRPDSVQEKEVYANPKTRKVLFRAKGRMA